MKKCRFCPEVLEEGSTICPGCGKDNAEEVTAPEETKAEETVNVEEAAQIADAAQVEALAETVDAAREGASTEEAAETAEADASAEEAAVPKETTPAAEETAQETVSAEEAAPAEKKVTPGKLALVIGGIVVVIAVIVALLVGGAKPAEPAATEPAALDTTVPVPTIPADGNPDDETCKGTYTVTDEEAIANADTVVATIGAHQLTNAQLQPFYWMQVQSFLSSDYGTYMMYYGVLDYTQPLDTQVCAMTGNGTWQQFFLAEALNSWQNYCALADQASAAEMDLTEEEKEMMASLEETMQANAEFYGMESVDELLKHNMGAGATLNDYAYFQELLLRGNKFYDAEVEKINPTLEELEAFFAEHEADYGQSGITREGKLVDVRHVLFVPEGGETDENGATTYSEEEWAACEAKAQAALDDWAKGDATEKTFGDMAMALSQDPGSQSNGGLYEGVQQGQMVEAFDAWCFDETREPGHSGMVKTNYGYHLMYFVDSTPIWENYARQDYVAEQVNAMMQELTENYPMDVNYSAITLGLVNLGG